jgi:AraC-like DNA-binding protein
MRTRLVGRVLAHAEARGLDLADVLRAHRLKAAARDGLVAIEIPALRAFLDDVAERLGDPDLGLHVAQQPNRGTYGVFEFAIRSAPTLRDALARALRYQRLVNDIVEMRLDRGAGTSTLVQRFPGEPLGGGRHGNLYAIALVVVLARDVTRAEVRARRVWLAHPGHGESPELGRFLGTDRIDDGAGHNAIEFDDSVLDLRVASADPALLDVMDRIAPLLAATRGADDGMAARATAEVRAVLGKNAPTLRSIAGRMSVAGRTLQRTLSEAGTTFQAIVDGARREVVMGLLSETALPLDEIAARAGYADVRALKRSFRRWTGSTPARWKHGAAAED